jgi:hypothetical protein
MVQRHLDRPDSLIAHSVVSIPLVESLIHGFLLVADHPHRKHLLRLLNATDLRRCVPR